MWTTCVCFNVFRLILSIVDRLVIEPIIDKFLKRKSKLDLLPPILENDEHEQVQPILKRIYVEVDLTSLPAEPRL